MSRCSHNSPSVCPLFLCNRSSNFRRLSSARALNTASISPPNMQPNGCMSSIPNNIQQATGGRIQAQDVILKRNQAVSVSTLKTKVRKLADDLSQHGFEHFAPYLVRRYCPNLAQFIELQPGQRSLEGKFACNMAWKFTDPEIPGDNTFHHAIRVERWFPHEPREALEESYAQVLRMIETYVLPFLDSVDSLEKLVAQYESALA